jgi:hypothetical protein
VLIVPGMYRRRPFISSSTRPSRAFPSRGRGGCLALA